MAAGHAAADATGFELVATQGLGTWGICSALYCVAEPTPNPLARA